MRTIIALCLSVFLIGVGTSSAQAASQDECAIWLCLPGGFPSGCGAAHSAMIDRIKDFKSPLPSLSSCVVSGDGGGMSHDYGVAAYIPPSRGFCTRAGYETYYDYTAKMEKQRYVCLEREQIPARYVPGQSCRDVNIGEGTFEKRPLGCTRTAYYVKMYNEDGTELQIDGSSDDGFYYIRPWDH